MEHNFISFKIIIHNQKQPKSLKLFGTIYTSIKQNHLQMFSVS